VAAVEAAPAIAKLALEGPLRDRDFLLGIGDPEAVVDTPGFRRCISEMPQILVHPASARAEPEFAERMAALASRAALSGRHLSVAVVGPIYGGSLPIAGYLERGLARLGHRTLMVDPSVAWPLYDAMTHTVKGKRPSSQLGGLLINFLSEWSYVRVAEFGADICIVLAQAPVTNLFPIRLRQEGIVTAYWFVENWRHMHYWKDIAPLYDCFFHIQPGEFERKLAEIGCPHQAFVQTGCDPELHKPVSLSADEREEFECDISFAGAGYYNRLQMFQGLTDYRFKVWGVDWPAREIQSVVCRPERRFSAEEFRKIVAGSKINLNLHSSTTRPGVDPECDAINPRVFEIAACGGFQLCDPCVGLERFFDLESELPTYRSLAELRAQIDYYLEHQEERKAIVEHARRRALRDHTYERRAEQMLDLILDWCGPILLRKGIRVQRSVAEVAERVGRDTPLGRYLASLPPHLLFTQENINERLTSTRSQLTHPEAVFAYLREVRAFAEQLLAERS
jgi:spore maturation protein CgeB